MIREISTDQMTLALPPWQYALLWNGHPPKDYLEAWVRLHVWDKYWPERHAKGKS